MQKFLITKKMKIELDRFGLWYLLESCLRGSHLRSGIVKDFTDHYFERLTPGERKFLYEQALDKIYDGEFKPMSTMCEHDTWFMARYNPDNQYLIKIKGYKDAVGFKMPNEDAYYIAERTRINDDFILEVTKIEPTTDD